MTNLNYYSVTGIIYPGQCLAVMGARYSMFKIELNFFLLIEFQWKWKNNFPKLS